MSILFVLLTFLLIITVMYFRRPTDAVAATLQVAPPKNVSIPTMLKQAGFEVPKGYCFHPGHTWVLDEGRQNARVGIDAFAGNLFGKIDSIELADLNRWVRQGQKLCTIKREGHTIDLLSPVEGVLISVNHEVLKNPNLVIEDPYKNGWLCVVKAPELPTNVNNLLQGPMVAPWMQNSIARLGAMVSHVTPALAQNGGLPINGLFFQVEANVQHKLVKEFFLT
jgi:glycine cleavage system H lipoate-binding protein